MLTCAMFIDSLVSTGQVVLPHPVEAGGDVDLLALRDCLTSLDSRRRAEVAQPAPRLDVDWAVWAADSFFRACQLTVHRDVDSEHVDKLLPSREEVERGASAHWSVDLAFRYLPDLHRLASGVSPSDPLNVHLINWANDWPMSSVGVKATPDTRFEVDAVMADPCLRATYVDRIVDRADWARLTDPAVRRAVRDVFGGLEPWLPQVTAAIGKAEESHESASD